MIYISVIIAQSVALTYCIISNIRNREYREKRAEFYSKRIDDLSETLFVKNKYIELLEQKCKKFKTDIHKVRHENISMKYFHNIYKKKLIVDFEDLIHSIEKHRKILTSTKSKDYQKNKFILTKEKDEKIKNFDFRLKDFFLK